MNDLNLYLYRHTANTEGDVCCIGDLYIEDEFFCFTLEDQLRYKDVKVYGQTCIAAGKYKVDLTMSNRFKRVMPVLRDVPMFEGIRMHGGNTSKDTLGCPLVAFNTDFKKIWGTAEKLLTKRLLEHSGDIYITIQNKFLTYSKYSDSEN